MLTCVAQRGRRGEELRGTVALMVMLMGRIWARQNGSFAATQTTDKKERRRRVPWVYHWRWLVCRCQEFNRILVLSFLRVTVLS